MRAWIRNMASNHCPGWEKASISNWLSQKLKGVVCSHLGQLVPDLGNEFAESHEILAFDHSDLHLENWFLFLFLGSWHKRLSFPKGDDCSWFWKWDLLKKSHWKCELWAHWFLLERQALTVVFWAKNIIFLGSTSEVKCTIRGLIFAAEVLHNRSNNLLWSSPSDAVEVWCYQRADCGSSLSALGKWALRLQPHVVENWMSQRISNWAVVEDVTVSVHNIDLYWAFLPASDNVHPNPARWIMGIKRVFLPAAAGAQTLVPYSQSSPCPFST